MWSTYLRVVGSEGNVAGHKTLNKLKLELPLKGKPSTVFKQCDYSCLGWRFCVEDKLGNIMNKMEILKTLNCPAETEDKTLDTHTFLISALNADGNRPKCENT